MMYFSVGKLAPAPSCKINLASSLAVRVKATLSKPIGAASLFVLNCTVRVVKPQRAANSSLPNVIVNVVIRLGLAGATPIRTMIPLVSCRIKLTNLRLSLGGFVERIPNDFATMLINSSSIILV